MPLQAQRGGRSIDVLILDLGARRATHRPLYPGKETRNPFYRRLSGLRISNTWPSRPYRVTIQTTLSRLSRIYVCVCIYIYCIYIYIHTFTELLRNVFETCRGMGVNYNYRTRPKWRSPRNFRVHFLYQ
jgi:hypothetical protein